MILKLKNVRLCFLIMAILFISEALGQSDSTVYDIVIIDGRVIDPETKLDAVKNVGIIENRIVQISSKPLKGKQIINATGLVVSPGFIDLHVHGRTNQEQEYQLHDGLTTALELEWGIENLKDWYNSRHGKALINYGASVNWPYERFKTIEKYKEEVSKLSQLSQNGESSLVETFNTVLPAQSEILSQDQIDQTLSNIKSSLAEGGIGIGVPVGYLPKTHPGEMYQVFKLAGELDALIFTHVRDPNIFSIQEVIANAALTNSPLHIVHINSMALGNINLALDMIQAAQNNGLDITTEVYPYTAASTVLQSAMFSEGWQERLGINYDDLQWVATGERLTKETFERYRKIGGTVIMHMMKAEWIETGSIWCYYCLNPSG
jgi:hypothetical protein